MNLNLVLEVIRRDGATIARQAFRLDAGVRVGLAQYDGYVELRFPGLNAPVVLAPAHGTVELCVRPAAALQTAEELGYERGLRAGRAERCG